MAILKERALLVYYSASQPKLTAVDSAASREVEETKGAKKGRVKVVKDLHDKTAYGVITTFYNRARAWHQARTLPWLDNGLRILPSTEYLNYAAGVRKIKAELGEMADEYVAHYAERLDTERNQLGALFREADYESPAAVRSRFSIEISVYPVPDAGDFRLDQAGLPEVEKELLRAEAEERAMAAMRDLTAECYRRLHKVVAHLAAELGRADKVKYHDSLVGNIRSLLELLPGLNIAGDSALTQLADEVNAKLAGLDVDNLKHDEALRAAAADDADKLAKRIGMFC